MATGVLSDFQVYSEYINMAFYERLAQNLSVFNAASNGAITHTTGTTGTGYYRYTSFVKGTPGVESRDPTSVAGLTDNNVATDNEIAVKLFRRKHQAVTRDQWLQIGQDPRMFETIFGAQLAEDVVKEQIDRALAAANAAISNRTANLHDGSDSTLATADLVSGLACMGDKAGDIVCWIMHSKPYYDLVAAQISANTLNVSNFNIQTATPVTLNRPVVVVDSTSLTVSATGTRYITLGLTRDAVRILQRSPFTATDTVTGLANIVVRLQTEYDYELSIRGFKWDVANGSSNPSDGTLATASNWDRTATSDKDIAGVRIRTQ